MSVKITKKLKLLKLLDNAKEDFKEELERTVPPEIRKTIEGGNNPIKGGKQAKYSQSYIDQIEGKAMFFRKGSKVIAISALSNKELKDFRASKEAKDQTNKIRAYIKENNDKKFKGKKKSPVNLKLSGKMLDSMKSYQTVKGLMVYFTDKKAEWHNEGVPENNLPARRLLPNKSGEEFNRNIFNRIMDSLKKAVKKNL